MNHKPAFGAIDVIRVLLVTAIAALVMSVALAASAQADQRSDRREQIRYALETMRLDYNQYVARANDFRGQNCWERAPNCKKPPPYNDFDWTNDGCSWTPPPAVVVFNRACQQHDFGYRNFGKGLTLGRTERVRAYIDGRFLKEMRRMCRDPRVWGAFASYRRCRAMALSMYAVVRNRSDWSD